ncbi:MAG: methyltransferase domain-containing protein [Rhodospirillales bacterium]|nr:methyltransferase domain-containing protein [Rhodospirillales bacterium]MCY4003546.1 methyltransferase domain-containing protein [Rhodospirillales bacterium]
MGSAAEMETSVSDHYAALTKHMEKFGGDLLACHFGLWGPDTSTDREGLERANHTLVQGCNLGSGQHVLDAGCGVGGTAITLAEAYGVRVTGLTICEPHIAVASQHAEQRGVGHLVDFCYGDFMDLRFPDASFDAVLNHESFCYAPDKLTYLLGVYRVLKPGGRWQALEGLLSGMPMTEDQQTLHATAQRGWRMPPLEPWRDVLATLETAGFTEIRDQDLSAEVAQSTNRIRQGWTLLTFLNPRAGGVNRASREFMEASVSYDQGLQEGVFTYRLVAAARPA